jgi:hypothetical protein
VRFLLVTALAVDEGGVFSNLDQVTRLDQGYNAVFSWACLPITQGGILREEFSR